jgi:hypothetical protein
MSCFLPGRAKDLSAPLYSMTISALCTKRFETSLINENFLNSILNFNPFVRELMAVKFRDAAEQICVTSSLTDGICFLFLKDAHSVI